MHLGFGPLPQPCPRHSPSPSAPVNRCIAEQLSAHEISRSPEAHCDGPGQVKACERLPKASPRSLPTLLVSPTSFLHLQPQLYELVDGLTTICTSSASITLKTVSNAGLISPLKDL